jgi:hypothetical protein
VVTPGELGDLVPEDGRKLASAARDGQPVDRIAEHRLRPEKYRDEYREELVA